MSPKRLPRDDLALAKPVGPRALALVSDFTRFDPSELDSPESDHGVASFHEALREYAWLHVLVSRLKPIAHLVVTAQARASRSLEFNLGVLQREKLVKVVPPIEEFDPSARDCDVLLRHVPHAISWGSSLSLRGDTRLEASYPLACQGPTRPPTTVLLLPRGCERLASRASGDWNGRNTGVCRR